MIDEPLPLNDISSPGRPNISTEDLKVKSTPASSVMFAPASILTGRSNTCETLKFASPETIHVSLVPSALHRDDNVSAVCSELSICSGNIVFLFDETLVTWLAPAQSPPGKMTVWRIRDDHHSFAVRQCGCNGVTLLSLSGRNARFPPQPPRHSTQRC